MKNRNSCKAKVIIKPLKDLKERFNKIAKIEGLNLSAVMKNF